MNMRTKILITLAAASLLSACNTTPSTHQADNYGTKGYAVKRNNSNAQYANKYDDDEAVVGKMQKDADYDEENLKVADNSPEFKEFARFSHNNKCIAAKPIGGIEQHIYFAFDDSHVTDDDFRAIRSQARYMLSHPNVHCRIEGNTDDRGSREYNVALGARRAKAVIAILKQEGVTSDRIHLVSYGAEKPAALGESDDAYRCNRRADIVFEVG